MAATNVVERADEEDGELAIDDGRESLVVDVKVIEAHLCAVLDDGGAIGDSGQDVVVAILRGRKGQGALCQSPLR